MLSHMGRKLVIQPRYFSGRTAWRTWLQSHHASVTELWVTLYKKHVARGLTYPEAVEEALCFGWIDGQLRRLDDEKHMLRFTPRRPGSVWAPSNIARVRRLTKEKKMTLVGLKVFTPRKHPERVALAATTTTRRLPADLGRALRTKPIAWKRFQSYPPSHRQRILWWVMSARQSATRQRRIQNVVSNLVRYARPHW